MKEPVIWNLDVPPVSVEDLLQAQQGVNAKRPPRPNILKLNQKILEEAGNLVRPILIWKEAEISGAGTDELYLKEGPVLKSKLLAKVAGTADQLILYGMTIGDELERRITEYNQEGKMLEAFTLDTAGSVFLAKSTVSFIHKLGENYKRRGMALTFPMGPGHSYWEDLEDLGRIINYIDGEKIGISLTTSNLMMPRKSLAFVMGAGQTLPDFEGKTHCDFCSIKKTCKMRGIEGKC